MDTQHTTPPSPPARRRTYKKRGPQTWALIREQYLAGATAPELAERYDVTVWAIRRRATSERWTKRAHAVAAEALAPRRRAEADDGWAPAACVGFDATPDAAALARRALQGVGAAIAAGRLEQARALAQLADVLSRMAQLRRVVLDEADGLAGIDLDTEEAMRAELLDRLAARARAMGLAPAEP